MISQLPSRHLMFVEIFTEKKYHRLLLNYACLQALVNNNAYMENQLYWFEKHPKSICPSVQSHYFEVHDVKKHT